MNYEPYIIQLRDYLLKIYPELTIDMQGSLPKNILGTYFNGGIVIDKRVTSLMSLITLAHEGGHHRHRLKVMNDKVGDKDWERQADFYGWNIMKEAGIPETVVSAGLWERVARSSMKYLRFDKNNKYAYRG